ncbi:ATP-dependent helicase/nuclease subunit A [Dysgonomonas sp. PH5-45]|uniref:UvrD-helicase domain-containing protein n=1 Tax=unclassified Dysgonomonas TaxID=2630389 RepID=UPI002473BEED|nr:MULTISPECIES: UvrD-helicase domain-containing protein [unclassified Dysgonomonas]MDH6355178.1 ATP-dependent helicase/nuclease subunit A [Dysgonomonas sp. PH5-45]MDH6388096.1 ATP-dependent helicase/nuclease subunit A [Dysgonomonas sp. PH5-37]
MPNRESSENTNLIVYRASAGSGKTHRLTGEYLRLLFSSPYAYRHILAVTFTNKATDEMKSRIVDELANLASGKPSDYIPKLISSRFDSEEKIREEARIILQRILHDYSAFSVSTIDRFFQQTMRAFTRELGLGGGYNVELDTEKVLNEAIDSMLYDLEKTGNKQLLEWLIRFSEEKIESGETWNIRNDIRTLSNEIFKESYKAFSDKVQQDIANKQLLDDYKQMLRAYIRQFEATSQQIGEKALNVMERYGLLPDDFKGGTRSPFFSFLRWAKGEVKEPTATFCKLAGDVSVWYLAKDTDEKKQKIESAFSGGLNECVCDIIEHYQNSRNYQTAVEINRYYFTLGILGDVDKKIREYAAENNIMLISDTTELLNKIISGTDTPFIYEKVGTHIDNYMIDEFQDTSNMQWINFSPLLKDSLAAGRTNLIVGDVKQSIYRWRNSDWKLLDEQLDIDFRTEGITHRSLNTNWRSLPNVVNFNNAVFTRGAKLVQEEYNNALPEGVADERLLPFRTKIEKAYKDSFQEIPAKGKQTDGHVSIRFLDKEDATDWQAESLNALPGVIESLQDKGYRLRDIAILVRTKKEGTEVANVLLEHKEKSANTKYRYDIISDEALLLNASKSVKLIVSLFRYLQNPTDESLHALAVYEYYKLEKRLSPESALNFYFSASQDFPDEVKVKLERIQELSLYEMAEEIFDLFGEAMEQNESVYIQSFLDTVLDFTVRNTPDLESFLKWWDEAGVRKTVFTPDGQDAIRIMTIHKSKGLGFDVVLLPFCNWELDHKMPNILWCRPHQEPFNRLHLVPVKYSKNLRNTIFEYEYYDERLHAFVDNLNILYVAFTRAKKELIAFSPRPKDDGRITDISSLLWQCVNNPTVTENNGKPVIRLEENIDGESGVFEIGGDHNPAVTAEEDTAGHEIPMGALKSTSFDNRLKLKLKNKYFFSDFGQRDYGNMMHDILSRIKTIHDLENVIDSYCAEGLITTDEKRKVYAQLTDYLSAPMVADWYSGQYKVLNEVQILQTEGPFVRPDRVMLKDGEVVVVDYKFGQHESPRYVKQVEYYKDRIQQMGYTRLRGYIWYVHLQKVVEV